MTVKQFVTVVLTILSAVTLLGGTYAELLTTLKFYIIQRSLLSNQFSCINYWYVLQAR